MKILLLLSLLTGFNSFGADDRFEDHAVLSIEKHLDDTLKSFDSRSFSVVDFEKTSIQ
jgi:hypothetical protein